MNNKTDFLGNPVEDESLDKPKGKPLFGDALLSEQDKADLRTQAEKLVAEDFKKAARELYLKKAVAEVRQGYAPEEQIVGCKIDLPGHSKEIRINNHVYHHGITYDVPLSVYRSLADIMFCAWKHEEVLGNINRDRYSNNLLRDMHIRPGMENYAHPNSTIMRV